MSRTYLDVLAKNKPSHTGDLRQNGKKKGAHSQKQKTVPKTSVLGTLLVFVNP